MAHSTQSSDRFGLLKKPGEYTGVEMEAGLVRVGKDGIARIANEAANLWLQTIDPRTGQARLTLELFDWQIEHQTGPSSVRALSESIRAMRRFVADVVKKSGLLLVTSGTCPADPAEGHRIVNKPRFAMASVVHKEQMESAAMATNSTHVHVHAYNKDEAQAIAERLRPFVHIVAALSANSNVIDGLLQPNASSRIFEWGKLPTNQVDYPPSDSYAEYLEWAEQEVDRLHGEPMGDASLFHPWVRVHPKLNTVEIRCADVGLSADDDILVARLLHALAETVGDQWKSGGFPKNQLPPVDPSTGRVEYYQRSRRMAATGHFKSGEVKMVPNPFQGRDTSLEQAVDDLVEYVAPVLRKDEKAYEEFVTLLDRWKELGTGADRVRSFIEQNNQARRDAGRVHSDWDRVCAGQQRLHPAELSDLLKAQAWAYSRGLEALPEPTKLWIEDQAAERNMTVRDGPRRKASGYTDPVPDPTSICMSPLAFR